MNKTTLSIALAISSVLLGNACQNSNVGVKVANSNSTNSNSAVAAATPSPDANSGMPAQNAPADSPSASYLAAFNARNAKDVAGLKKLMSKDVLAFFAAMQKADNKTLDDALKELCEEPQAKTAEVRNEKVEGDTAWLEYKDENGGWQRMDFIKEDGTWKLTIPKDELRDAKASGDQKNG